MAVIPGTQFATTEPSGQTGQTLWNPPREGGGQEIAEGISKLGTVVLNYALNVQKKEMVAEIYEKQRLIDERGWAAREAVTGDEEVDKPLWDRFQSETQAISASSKYKDVNDELTQYLNQVSPNWQHGMFVASQKIRSDNADDQLRLSYTKILENGTIDENGRIPEGVEMLDKMLALRSITKVKYDALVDSMPGDIHIARANRLMTMGNYNLAQEELKQTDTMELTTEQLGEIRTLQNLGNGIQKQESERIEAEISGNIALFDLSKDPVKTMQDIRSQIDEAAAHKAIDGTQIRELTHFADSRVANAGKKATEREILEAKDDIQNLIDADRRVEAKKFLLENSWMFTTTDNEELLKDIRGTKTTDSMLTDAIAAEGDVAMAEASGVTDPEQIAQISVNSMRRRDEIRRHWKSNPDMTSQQKVDYVQKKLQSAKEEVVKKSAGWRARSEPNPNLKIWNVFGRKHLMPKNEPLNGLESIWDQLDDASKLAAVDLRARGVPAEELIAHFKKKTVK